MTRKIPLTKGKVALVDDADYEQISASRWFARWKDGRWYAVRRETNPNGLPRQFDVYMHRLILRLGRGDPRQGDHRDRNGLNNTRCNIRIASQSQNNANRISHSPSGFKGVSWHKEGRKWRAYISINHRQLYLGLYDDPEEAARTYDEKARELYGEFARTNFPSKMQGERKR